MRSNALFRLLLPVPFLILASCATDDAVKESTPEKVTPIVIDEDEFELEYKYPEYHGPRKTIAVARFDAIGAFVDTYGGWDIGGGIASMLITELQKSNRFIVVERAELDNLLREQELAVAEVTSESSPSMGELLGAQLLIRGSVTEFSQEDKGGGFSIGLGFDAVSTSAGRRKAEGTVGMDLRLIDTTTGRITDTHAVAASLISKSIALSAGVEWVSIGSDQFNNTSVGKATRAAIREAVFRIIDSMETVPWQAVVAQVNQGRIYINAGADANITPGQVLDCIRPYNEIIDPVTKRSLGSEEFLLGQLTIESVNDFFSIASIQSDTPPEVGDLVRIPET